MFFPTSARIAIQARAGEDEERREVASLSSIPPATSSMSMPPMPAEPNHRADGAAREGVGVTVKMLANHA